MNNVLWLLVVFERGKDYAKKINSWELYRATTMSWARKSKNKREDSAIYADFTLLSAQGPVQWANLCATINDGYDERSWRALLEQPSLSAYFSRTVSLFFFSMGKNFSLLIFIFCGERVRLVEYREVSIHQNTKILI